MSDDKNAERSLAPRAESAIRLPLTMMAERGLALAKETLPLDSSARDEAGRTALHRAAEGGDEAMVRFLVRLGADVNALTGKNESALSLAARGRHAGVIRVLLDASADPNLGGEHAPLFEAAASNDVNTMTLLLGAGAKALRINKVNDLGLGCRNRSYV